MNNSKVLKTILIISGLVIIIIGAAILFVPATFFATNGIMLGNDSSLLSEIRAPGGALLASGIFILAGAFVPRLTLTAVLLSALLYLSYGFSRILSMVVDGIPSEGILIAAVVELGIGLACLFALVKYRGNEYRESP